MLVTSLLLENGSCSILHIAVKSLAIALVVSHVSTQIRKNQWTCNLIKQITQEKQSYSRLLRGGRFIHTA